MDDIIYDHYIAIEWAIKNMAIARMTKKSNTIKVIDVPSDIAVLISPRAARLLVYRSDLLPQCDITHGILSGGNFGNDIF